MIDEVRSFDAELKTIEDSRIVEGYAIVVNSESRDLGGFTEVIESSAVNDDVIKNNEILALLDHNQNRGVLARSMKGVGSLHLETDERGLKYSFCAPHTALGDELLEGIRRGDINTSSFTFRVGEYEWEHRADGTYLRHIKSFKRVSDVSPVYIAAYDDTSVSMRSLEEFKEKEQKELEEFKMKEKEELNNYYKQLRSEI